MRPTKKASELGRALVALRHANLTPERRSEIAREAAKARWTKEKAKPKRKVKPKKKRLK